MDQNSFGKEPLELSLTWTEFIKVHELGDVKPNVSGVYLWGFTIDNNFIPYYIGIAYDIYFRIYEHIAAILSGKYTIYHRDSLAGFIQFQNQGISAELTAGKIYSPNWPAGYSSFLKTRKVLQPHFDFMIDTFTFTYAETNQVEISGSDLKSIEKICINQIGLANLANTRGGRSDKFKIQHSGNAFIVKSMNGGQFSKFS